MFIHLKVCHHSTCYNQHHMSVPICNRFYARRANGGK